MSEKLEESQQQLNEISASEESRLQELRKISQDRDRAWESELEAVQKHHSMDSAALAAAMGEIQKLKIQLEKVAESEAAQAKYAESAHNEMLSLRLELLETLAMVEQVKNQLNDCKDSEARALEQLEIVKSTEETLKSEKVKAVEDFDSLTLEFEKSKSRVNSLEGIVSKLQAENGNRFGDVGNQEELKNAKSEAEKLREALEGAERRYQEEYIQSTLQIRGAYELVEQTRSESGQKVAILEGDLEESKAELENLKAKVLEIEAENKNVNENLEKDDEHEIERKKLESDLADLKRVLTEKESELKNVTEEKARVAEAAIVAEREALMKVGYLTEEVEKSGRKVVRVAEELELAEAGKAEMEAELRRLKVQSEQWRKAAEAAAAMLSGGNNGKLVERTGSLDCHTIGGKLNSPFSEDMEDESPKKKNGNMLKKIGVLLKKSQK